jgi:DHA3 family macrolide efflux protein-like MFS transporter
METQADQKTFKNYLAFFSGQQISLLGSSMAQFVIIWWITIETKSALYLAVASFVGFAPMIILTPFAGVLVDRWNRKAIIGTVDCLQALTTIALIFLFRSGNISVLYVLVFLAVRSAYQAFNVPAVYAIIPLMVPQDKLSRVNGLNYLLSGTMMLMGPVVAATLLVFAKIGEILWVDPATFLVALAALLLIKIPEVKEKKEKAPFKEEFLEGLAFIKNLRGFVPLVLVATVLNFLLVPLDTLLSYFVIFDHFGGAEGLALIMACMQGGTLAGGVLMSVIKGFKRKMFTATAFIYLIFVGYALVAVTPTGAFWFMALGALLLGFGVAPANVSILTIIQSVVSVKMQGRVNSVMITLASAATPLGMVLAGAIVEFTGTVMLFLGCVVAGVFTLTISWFFTDVKHVEEMENETFNSENQKNST